MYAIARAKRIKDNGKFSKMCMHNLRDDTKHEKNIDPEKSHRNEIFIDKLNLSNGGEYSQKLENYYKSKDVKSRKNSVVAMEFVLTASPEFFKNNPKSNWAQHQLEFIKNEWGDNCKLAVIHKDESTDHIHVMVSTEETKTQRFKNRYGEGEKYVTSLNAKRFDRKYLIDLQTRYAKHNEKFGLKRGVRNSEANHKDLRQHRKDVADAQNADYTKEINSFINKTFNEKTLFGPKKYGVDEIKEGLTPFVNKLVKKQKHLKTKAESTSPATYASLLELDKQRLKASEEVGQTRALRADYMDAINSKRSDEKRIAELQEELEKWKPKPQEPQVVKGENLNLQPQKPKKPEFEPPEPSFVNRMKPR